MTEKLVHGCTRKAFCVGCPHKFICETIHRNMAIIEKKGGPGEIYQAQQALSQINTLEVHSVSGSIGAIAGDIIKP